MMKQLHAAGLIGLLACGVGIPGPTAVAQAHTLQSGGGAPLPGQADDVSPNRRALVEFHSARQEEIALGPRPLDVGPAPYPFVPVAGTLWQDRFVQNFVDLDPTSPGILDWDCTDYTVNGHIGHDMPLHSFGEQDIGVPVFAALDGTVVATHDGDYDRNTVMNNQPASGNYVVLLHAGTHYSDYWKLRSNSVTVSVGQFVRAGTQIGLVGSSGNSSWPHLHFGSYYNGAIYEPSAGACRPGQSGWVNQIPIRRDLYIDDFAVHNTNNFPGEAFLPYEPARTGTIVRTGAVQPIGAWYILHNQPANSNWRVRYLRPDATALFDSGLQFYGNPFNRWSWWWFQAPINPDIAGAWSLELSINGQVIVQAPFTVLDSGGVPTNRPPKAISAAFDPPNPTADDVLFCRVSAPLLEDPDYDLMSYRFQWQVNGQVVRDITNAAFSDAIPRATSAPGDLVTCTATPFDGHAFGPPSTAQALVAGGPPVNLTVLAVATDLLSLHWPTSHVNYVLESVSNLSTTSGWTVVTDAQTTIGSEVVVTNQPAGASRFYRLRWP